MRCGASANSGKPCRNQAGESGRCHLHLEPRTANTIPLQGDALQLKDALYYPYIEIDDNRWLRTAALYWDTIATIVPDGMGAYERGGARVLRDAGVLDPVFVDPDMPETQTAAEVALEFLHSEEGRRVLRARSPSGRRTRIHSMKFANTLAQRIHSAKLPRAIQDILMALDGRRSEGPWLRVPPSFADFYMTVLAGQFAASRGRALVTDLPAHEPFAARSARGDNHIARGRLAEGLLADFTLEAVAPRANTSMKKIVAFRERHSDELGRFRAAIHALAAPAQAMSLEALQRHASTVYSDQVRPAIADLEGRFRDCRISFGLNTVRASAFMSVSPTVLGAGLAAVGLGRVALVAGLGLSVVLGRANYRIQQREILRGSPYSYVLAAKREFRGS